MIRAAGSDVRVLDWRVMLSFLPAPVTVFLGALLVSLNTVGWSFPLFGVALLKLVLPIAALQGVCRRVLNSIAESWIAINTFLIGLFTKTRWEMEGFEDLDPQGWYMVVSNHQSWVDIPVLQKAFNRKIPLLRFFLKQSLIWVPILGLAWWALDFPFMKRYSREQLARRPALKGKDLETTRKACAKYRSIPVSIMNFLEGTRFTEEKHRRGSGEYRHLLAPRAGGLAFVLSSMGSELRSLLDVTIVYPDGRPTFYQLFAGRIPRIKVIVKHLEIPEEMIGGDYSNDPEFRQRFQSWVSELWHAKDQLIEDTLAA
jgi:1-acyl-sn-glycerol-3-phosphate acyltransferase